MDGIGSSWLTIILVFLVVGGMVFFVTFSTAEKLDSTIETSIKQDLNEFVNECSNLGEIQAEKVDALYSKLNSYGIRFDLKLTVKRLDTNPTKKTTQLNNGVTEATPYIIEEYTPDEIINKGVLKLKENDWIGASVENISSTHADNYSGQQNADFSTIVVEDGATVRANSSN